MQEQLSPRWAKAVAEDIMHLVSKKLKVSMSFGGVRKTIGKQKLPAMKVDKCRMAEAQMKEVSESVNLEHVRDVQPALQVMDLCDTLVKDTKEKNALVALRRLLLKCDISMLEEAVTHLSKETRTAGTTDAKIRQAAACVFGLPMRDVKNKQETLHGIIQTCELMLKLMIATVDLTRRGKFDLGQFRALIENVVEFKKGSAAATGSSAAAMALEDEDEDDDDDVLATALRSAVTL